MKNNPLILFVLALAAFLFAGCAATPMVTQLDPIQGDLSRYSAVQVVVDATDIVLSRTGYDITATELRREFIANVVASRKYAVVDSDPRTPKSLEARLTITSLNYVSGAARGTGGILGGRAVLGVTMTLKDNETGRVVGSVSANHSSSHAQGVFSPVTSVQITAIAKELSDRLTNK